LLSERSTTPIAHHHPAGIRAAAARLYRESYLKAREEMRREGRPDGGEVGSNGSARSTASQNPVPPEQTGPSDFEGIICRNQGHHPSNDPEKGKVGAARKNASLETLRRPDIQGTVAADEETACRKDEILELQRKNLDPKMSSGIEEGRACGASIETPPARQKRPELKIEMSSKENERAERASVPHQGHVLEAPMTGARLDETNAVTERLGAETNELERPARLEREGDAEMERPRAEDAEMDRLGFENADEIDRLRAKNAELEREKDAEIERLRASNAQGLPTDSWLDIILSTLVCA